MIGNIRYSRRCMMNQNYKLSFSSVSYLSLLLSLYSSHLLLLTDLVDIEVFNDDPQSLDLISDEPMTLSFLTYALHTRPTVFQDQFLLHWFAGVTRIVATTHKAGVFHCKKEERMEREKRLQGKSVSFRTFIALTRQLALDLTESLTFAVPTSPVIATRLVIERFGEWTVN